MQTKQLSLSAGTGTFFSEQLGPRLKNSATSFEVHLRLTDRREQVPQAPTRHSSDTMTSAVTSRRQQKRVASSNIRHSAVSKVEAFDFWELKFLLHFGLRELKFNLIKLLNA